MASQPIIPFPEPRYQQPKPRVSFAVIAGDGAQAVDAAVRTLPQALREATLDNIAAESRDDRITAETRSVAEEAARLLSPPMYEAFLDWAIAASHFATVYEEDEEGEKRCEATVAAVEQVSRVPARNVHDLAIKQYLLLLEAMDCSSFGPLSRFGNPNRLVEVLSLRGMTDFSLVSSLPARVDGLATLLWELSTLDIAYDLTIGTAVSDGFSAARLRLFEVDPHRALLDERNSLIQKVNDCSDLSDEQFNDDFGRASELEHAILETPPHTTAGLIAQLTLAVQVTAEGNEFDEETARELVRNAKRVVGSGYLFDPPGEAA